MTFATITLTSLLYYFRTRRFKRKNTLSRISNIYYASDAEAAKISNIGSCVPKRSLTLLHSKTVSILAETRLGDARGSWNLISRETVGYNKPLYDSTIYSS